MLGQNVQYDFDPSNEDIIGKITIIDDLHKEQLEAEARKNVLKISKEIKVPQRKGLGFSKVLDIVYL